MAYYALPVCREPSHLLCTMGTLSLHIIALGVKHTSFGIRSTWVCIPTRPLTSYVISDESLSPLPLFELLPQLTNRDEDTFLEVLFG